MALPATAILDGIRSLSGKARITFPGGVKTMERVARFPKADWELEFLATTVDPEDADCILIDQQKLKEDAQYIEAYRIYKKLPGPEIVEDEYVPELNEFILTKKRLVYDLGQTGTRAGGTGAADLEVTEYRSTDNPRVRIKIVSVFPVSMIGGSGSTFRAPISYAIPAEIPIKPTVKRVYPPQLATFAAVAGFEWVAFVASDMALDFDIKQGYTKNFSATVTRTLDLEPSSAAETNLIPEGYSRVVILQFIDSTATLDPSHVVSKLVPIHIPPCIHADWEITVGYKISLLMGEGNPPSWGIDPDSIDDPVIIRIPQTSPASIPYGQEIIAKVVSSPWRGGLYVNDIYKIVIPYPA